MAHLRRWQAVGGVSIQRLLEQLLPQDVAEVLGHDSLLLHAAVVLDGQDDWIFRYLLEGSSKWVCNLTLRGTVTAENEYASCHAPVPGSPREQQMGSQSRNIQLQTDAHARFQEHVNLPADGSATTPSRPAAYQRLDAFHYTVLILHQWVMRPFAVVVS